MHVSSHYHTHHVAKIPAHVAKIPCKILAEYNPRYYLCPVDAIQHRPTIQHNTATRQFTNTINFTSMNTQTSNKTAQKYFDILNSGSITEQQIISLRSYLNNKGNADFKREFFNKWEDELTLSLEQNQKGYDFLISQWKTPTGRERVNNPFGYREQSILENFKDFTLKGLYDAGNMYVQNYLPLYSCNSNDGGSFEYYYYNGKINIVG